MWTKIQRVLRIVAIALGVLVGTYELLTLALHAATAPGQLIVEVTQVQQSN